MSLTLHVDGDRWRGHLRQVLADEPNLVPVAKGNGYGFGLGRLARRAQWLGVSTLAVGTYDELGEVADRFAGDLLVLTPWRGFLDLPEGVLTDPRVLHTLGRPEDVAELRARGDRPRVLLERATSMRRHGFSAAQLRDLDVTGLRVQGVALHLPLGRGGNLAEVERLMDDVVAARLDTRTVYVSHLSADELGRLRAAWPDYTFAPRIGTGLWLGDRGALQVCATVLDVHQVRRGETYGYRGRPAPAAGHLLVVSGGTAHGIGLEAPTGETSLRNRAASLVRGGMDALGLVHSPFLIDGKQRLFAEPPHMQASMLFLPSGTTPPAPGDEVDLQVRFTATTFDRVLVR